MDVAYGGENGFSQAIELASESLLNVRYVAERKLLSKLFEEILLVLLQFLNIRSLNWW